MRKIPIRDWFLLMTGVIGISIGKVGCSLVEQTVWIKFFDNVHWTFGTLMAALLAWSAYQQAVNAQEKVTRKWFAIGFSGYAIGQIVWNIQTFYHYEQFPAPSDLFYLWLGPCLLVGLYKEIDYRQNTSHKVIFLDILSLSIAALALILVIYLPRRGSLDILSLSVLIAYPLSLLVVASTVLMMIPSLRLRISLSLVLFVVSSIVTAWSWMRWNLLALKGMTIDGDVFNVSFSIAILIAGFSIVFRQLDVAGYANWDKWCEGFLRFLPLVNVLLACMALVVVSTHQTLFLLEHFLTLSGAVIVILLAIIRQLVLLHEYEQLVLTQSLLRTVLDTVPLRVFWKDKECCYLGCNTAFAQDAGFISSSELLGKNDYQLSWRNHAASYQADDQSVMKGQQVKLNYEEQLMTSDGNLLYLKTSKVPLVNQLGTVIGVLGVYEDISLLKGYQDKLKLTARVFDNTEEGIMITNAQCELIEVNHAFTKITGYARVEVLGQHTRLLKSGYHDAEFYQSMWQVLKAVGHWSGEIWNCKKNGEIYPEWITISAIADTTGLATHYVGIFSDISVLKQHEKQLEYIAHYDALTGVPNRVLLADRLKQAIAQTQRGQKFLVVGFLDLDGFKPINDKYGHSVGDLVLIKFAERVSHSIRQGDTLARLGGDEFVILFLGLEKITDCLHSVERLLEQITQPIFVSNRVFTITASIGITIYPNDNQDADTLLRHADQAMYKAKQAGKNCYFLYDAEADQQAYKQHRFFNEVQEGLRRQQFELFYQPKVDMFSRKVIGAEALIRWHHPERGLLLPALFLPMIENSELEVELGDWVIEQAIRQINDWLLLGLELSISVNITGQQLLDIHFLNKLQNLFITYPKVPHSLLELEILETTALEIERSCQVIMTIGAELGINFALDDFGTGYSTLTYLKQFPVSILKIDQSFVRDMLDDFGDRAIVEGVIALAKVFGRQTVAEGVETEEHFLMLKKMGCHFAQGYGIAKPMPATVFYQWYLKQ